jgi:DNA topoisomerase-1
VVKFPGFLKVYQESREEDEPESASAAEEEGEGLPLPPLQEGEVLDLVRLLAKQHFTQPPPRYSEASLIRALEEYGIGRPSTYAPILTTIVQRGYVERVEKKLVPTELGFTAEMEGKLDGIAAGEAAWVPMLREFYGPFARTVEAARTNMPRIERKPEPTGELCPRCGQPLLYKQGKRGKFIGCSAFPNCRYTAPIPLPGVTCPQCGGAVVEKRTRRGRKFYSCANWRPDDETACQWSAWKL